MATLKGRGGIAPYTWDIVSGALPTGITYSLDSSGDFVLSGTTSLVGNFDFVLLIRDSQGRSRTRAFTLQVQAEPLTISGDAPAGQVGVPYSFTYTVGGGLPSYTFSISSGALPAGLSLNASTGEISGTPSSGATTTFRVRVTDSQSPPAMTDLDDSIVVSYATLAVAGAWTGVEVGEPLEGSPRAITGGLAPYSVTLLSGTRPPGVTISISGSTLVATGDTTTPGTYTWTDRVTSTDGQHVDIATTLEITYVPQIYVAGLFDNISSTAHSGIARYALDGTHDAAYTPSITSASSHQVFGIEPLADRKKVVVGGFSAVNGSSRSNIAVLAEDGSLDSLFASTTFNSACNCVVVQSDGKIIVGGNFSQVNGAARTGIARFNADGSVDTSFAASIANVQSLAIQTDGKIVVGFNGISANGTTRNRIARLNGDGTLDTGFDPNASAMVSAVHVLSSGKILVAGNFTTIGGQTYGRVARLNTDGAVDTGFTNPAANNAVSTMTVQADGKIIVGGSFTSMSSTTRQRLARINADGTLDTGYACNSNGTVNTIALLPSGALVSGGAFTTIGGVSRTRAAIVNDDASVASWNPAADAGVQTVFVG